MAAETPPGKVQNSTHWQENMHNKLTEANITLQTSEEEKDLGIITDPALTFENHITDKVNIAN
jgi:hypothetical protein